MRGVMRLMSWAAATTLAVAPAARSADLQVPAQHATIQQAIAAATAGDRVLVQPGTYAEALDFLGKGIEVIGVGGAAATILDATGLNESVVRFTSGEPATTLLRGFTLTGGAGRKIGAGPTRWGGGVFITGSARPSLRDCVITGNTALGDAQSSGGGVGVWLSTSPPGSGLKLIDCLITGNSAEGRGGGVSSFGAGLLATGCTLSGNQAAAGGGIDGGGAYTNCQIVGNAAQKGGGAHGLGALASLVDCTLADNTASGFGGGVYLEVANGSAVLNASRCILRGNTALFGGGAYLAASVDTFFGPFATVTGCAFSGNASTAIGGGGLHVSLSGLSPTSGTTTVTQCSFSAQDLQVTGSHLVVRNCIVRNSTVPFTSPGTITVNYSDIGGGWPGTGNIDADPLWVDAVNDDLRLLSGSPCIDAGDPASPLDPDGTRADMGALPYRPWTNLGGGVVGGAGAAILSGSGSLLAGTPVAITLAQAPSNSTVILVLGAVALGAPFKTGVFWPTLDHVLSGVSTDAGGSLQLSGTWPSGLPSGFSVFVQAWWIDAGAPAGYAGSNGLRGTVP